MVPHTVIIDTDGLSIYIIHSLCGRHLVIQSGARKECTQFQLSTVELVFYFRKDQILGILLIRVLEAGKFQNLQR